VDGSQHRVLVQISDCHIIPDGLQHGVVDTLANLGLVLDRVENSGLQPDAFVLSGDLTDAGQPEGYRLLRQRVEESAGRLGVPVVYLPGNHDERGAFRQQLLDEEPSGEPIDQVLWCGGLRVVALDSTVPGHDHGELSAEQLEFLAEELRRPAPEGTVLVLHHPPVPSPIASMSRIALYHPERLEKVVAGSDVRIILAGHNHHAMSATLGETPVWLCPATAYQADPLVAEGRFRGYPGAGFSRIDVGPEAVQATAVMGGVGAGPIVDVPMSEMPID